MTETPILAICVPTFNRSGSLRNLFKNLQDVKRVCGRRIEICVSNNHSTDDTESVISEWREALDLKIYNQSTNVGANQNFIAVTRLCEAKWTMLVGDDDGLISENVLLLLSVLDSASQSDWILADVNPPAGNKPLLSGLRQGKYSKRAFRGFILKTGLYPHGFMGIHVFPASARPTLAALTQEEAKPWLPIALLLRELEHGHVYVFKPAVVVQATGDTRLFWNAADLPKITLERLRIITNARLRGVDYYLFTRILMLRELYNFRYLSLLLGWKLYENADFRQTAISAHLKAYRHVGSFQLLTAPHFLVVLILLAVPHSFMKNIFRMAGREHYISRYTSRKSKLKAFNGISRGL